MCNLRPFSSPCSLERQRRESEIELEEVRKVGELRIQEIKQEHEVRGAVLTPLCDALGPIATAVRLLWGSHQMKEDYSWVAALEERCQWLANRVTQLQQLVDAMQVRALACPHSDCPRTQHQHQHRLCFPLTNPASFTQLWMRLCVPAEGPCGSNVHQAAVATLRRPPCPTFRIKHLLVTQRLPVKCIRCWVGFRRGACFSRFALVNTFARRDGQRAQTAV